MNTKVLVLGLVAAAAAMAQSSNGYLYFAPGGVSSYGHTAMTLQAGAGADLLIAKGIGANVEVGAVWPRQCFSDCVVGVFSPGGAYYFRRGKEHKLDPFVNGGYTLMFRQGHENLFYFGGGANYWMTGRVGLRMEFRDQVSTAYSTAHFWGFRLGLAFR
jgi:hypothetical protein